MLNNTGDKADPWGRPGVIDLTFEAKGPTRKATFLLRSAAPIHRLNRRSMFPLQTTLRILNDALVLCIFNHKVIAMADFHDSNGQNLKNGQTE